MKRNLVSLVVVIAFAIFVCHLRADEIDLTVDSGQSSVNITLLGASDSSTVSGSGTIDLVPPSEPFGTAQMTDLNLILDDGFFLSLFGGFVTVSADPGSVTMTLATPGPPGNVDQNNQFQQSGNIATLAGLIDIFDPLNLFIGTGTYDLADFGDAPFDITDAQLDVNGNVLSLTVNFIVEQEVSPGVLLIVTGTVVSNGILPVIVNAERVEIVLGTNTGGDLADTNESDDVYFCFFRGNPFAINLPSVWLDFESTLPTGSPATLALTVEAHANTNDIDQKIWAYNYDSGQWELLDTTETGFNTDVVVTVAPAGDILRFVEMGTGKVKMRVTYTQGPNSLGLAWTVCLDQVAWKITE